MKSVSNLTPDVNGRVTYTVTATNAGPSDAGLVVVTDVLPSGVTFDSSSASSGTVARSGQKVTWTIPDLAAPGTSYARASLQIVVTIGTAATLTNAAEFTQTTPNGSGGTTGASNTTVVTPLHATLALAKTVANATPAPSSTDTYTIVVTDHGPDAAQGVVVTDPLPAGVSFTSASGTSGTVAETSSSGVQTVTWDVGTLPDGSAATLTVVVNVTATSGSIVNVAGVTDSTYDPKGQTRSATASAMVTAIVPSTNTGEPWSGPIFWVIVAALGPLGLAMMVTGRRRLRPRT